jgi:hypothetical protein
MSRNQVTSPSNPSDHGDWRSLYQAAILETNKNVILRKVSKAEQAVLARSRELVYGAGTAEEEEALADALYALRAFRSAWEHSAWEHPEAA